jgi:hypothetical protein
MTMSTLSPHFAAKLLRWGARRYGTSDLARDRYTEEWRAALDNVPGKCTKLLHSIGVILLTVVPACSRRLTQRLADVVNIGSSRVGTTAQGGRIAISGGGTVITIARVALLLLVATASLMYVLEGSAPSPSHMPQHVPHMLWRGNVTISQVGINLDSQVPSAGGAHSTLYWSASLGRLVSGIGVLVALWTPTSPPTDSGCRRLTNTEPIQYELMPAIGETICISTAAGHIASLRFIRVSGDDANAQSIAWAK